MARAPKWLKEKDKEIQALVIRGLYIAAVKANQAAREYDELCKTHGIKATYEASEAADYFHDMKIEWGTKFAKLIGCPKRIITG